MHFTLTVADVLFLLSFMASTAESAGTPPPSRPCLSQTVQVRLPPTLGPSTTAWTPVPKGWDLGNWYQTFSSSTQGSANAVTRNLQYQTIPIDPSVLKEQRSDLSSFQLVTNATVFTSYGVDTPVSGFVDVYNYTGTGILAQATDLLEVLAWGCDTAGVAYRVSYSTLTPLTQTPASIDVLSTTDKGPTLETLQELKSALIALGNTKVSELAQAIGQTIQDGARDGEPPLTCDAECQTNINLIGLF